MFSTAILCLSDSLTMVIFFLLAKGYNIINLKLLAKDKREIVIVIIFRIVLLWLYKLLGDIVLVLLGLLNLGLLIIVYRDLSFNIKKLQQKLDMLETDPNDNVAFVNIKKKFRALKFFKHLVVLYFLSVSFANIGGIFLFIKQPWIETLMTQILLLCVFYFYSLCFNIQSLNYDFSLRRIFVNFNFLIYL